MLKNFHICIYGSLRYKLEIIGMMKLWWNISEISHWFFEIFQKTTIAILNFRLAGKLFALFYNFLTILRRLEYIVDILLTHNYNYFRSISNCIQFWKVLPNCTPKIRNFDLHDQERILKSSKLFQLYRVLII